MNEITQAVHRPRASYQVALQIVSVARGTFPARCGICATCMTLELTLSLFLSSPSSSSPRRVSGAGMEREKSDRGHETERERERETRDGKMTGVKAGKFFPDFGRSSRSGGMKSKGGRG